MPIISRHPPPAPENPVTTAPLPRLPPVERWEGGVREVLVEVMGVPVTIRCGGSRAGELAEVVQTAWAWCPRTGPAEDPVVLHAVLDEDDAAVDAAGRAGAVAVTTLRVLADQLTPAVTVSAIERLAGRLLMLHACAVADPATGAAVVLVGPSGMGKTTLATTLGRQFGYVTDETAAVEADGTLRAFAKLLSVVRAGTHHKDQVPPAELGLLRAPASCRVAAVVLLDRRADHPATPGLCEVPTLPALAWLSEHTSYLKRLHRPLHRLAGLLDQTSGLRLLSYRDATDLAPMVATLLERR